MQLFSAVPLTCRSHLQVRTCLTKLKDKLCSDPASRSHDFEKRCIIQTDTSDRGIGAVLSHVDEEGDDHPVVYFSRKLLLQEEKYIPSH